MEKVKFDLSPCLQEVEVVYLFGSTPVRRHHLLIDIAIDHVTTRDPCHLASNFELEEVSNTSTLIPGVKCRGLISLLCSFPVTIFPVCEHLLSGLWYIEFHFNSDLVPPSLFFFKLVQHPLWLPSKQQFKGIKSCRGLEHLLPWESWEPSGAPDKALQVLPP